MLDNETKRRIDTARDILVGKVPDPKSQVEQITIALIYKFMDDMDAEAEELGGKRKFFSGEFDRYGWKKLMAPDLGGFDVLNLYAEAIQKMNINPNIPQLFRNIFKNAYLPYRDPETLKSFLKIIDDFEYDHSERLGDAFEYLLSVLGSQGDAGQFRTPRHIIDFMVDIIDPKKDNTILDPACGTAGFLISSYKHILKHNSTNFVPEKDKEAFEQTDVSIAELSAGGIKRYSGDKLTPDERAKLSKNLKGYDISPDMVRLSLVNLYLHGFTDPKIFEYDTLTSEDNWNEYADIVLANPPFMSPKGGIKPHKRFSIQSNRSEVLFVDYMVEHLTPNGKAAIIVPEGIIFQSGNAYKQLRKMLVENYLFAVVSLPAGVFQPYSGVKTSILLIDKALNKKTDKILFVKIENDGFDLGAQRRPNNKSQLLIAVRLVKEYITVCHTERSRSVNDIESILTEKFGPNNLWNIATKAKIAENDDWNLSSERYAKELYISTSYPLVKLKDLENNKKISFLRGSGISKKDIAENGKYKCIHYGDLYTKYDIVIQTVDSYTDIEGKVLSEKGDVLVPSTTTADALGISIARALNEDNVVLGGDINIIRTYNEHLNSKYLAYLISTPPLKIALSKYAKGTNILHLSNKDLEQLQIPLPPLEIQKEIVAEIEGWQKIIDGARQVVDNYKPQIDIAPEWPMVELGEVAYIISGQSPEGKYYNQEGEGMPFYQGKTEFGDMYIGEPKSWTTQITKEADAGDIVMSVRAPVGPVNFLICKSCIGRGLAAIKVTEKIDKIFLFNYIKSIEQNIKGGGGSVFDSINRKQISEIKIPLPDLIIQLEISESLKKEQLFVKANSELITLFEQKIKDKIAKVWGE